VYCALPQDYQKSLWGAKNLPHDCAEWEPNNSTDGDEPPWVRNTGSVELADGTMHGLTNFSAPWTRHAGQWMTEDEEAGVRRGPQGYGGESVVGRQGLDLVAMLCVFHHASTLLELVHGAISLFVCPDYRCNWHVLHLHDSAVGIP
jgi:hypothetical protein